MTSSNDSDGVNPYKTPHAAGQSHVGKEAGENVPAPAWGWAFLVACMAIMVPTRGGALWGVLGGVVGAACLRISQSTEIPAFVRVMFCSGMTVVLWAAILTLLMTVRGG